MELDDVRHALRRIQLEFTEMPEMRLTRSQVRRLLSLPVEACEAALASLVRSGFLVQNGSGAFVRRGVSRPQPFGQTDISRLASAF